MKTPDRAPTHRGNAAASSGSDRLPPAVRSADLLGDGQEVVILHDGQRYRLRLTRLGKLILTK